MPELDFARVVHLSFWYPDELMGVNRNLDNEEGVIDDFRDDRVCKAYLCGLCPHDLFRSVPSVQGRLRLSFELVTFSDLGRSFPYQRCVFRSCGRRPIATGFADSVDCDGGRDSVQVLLLGCLIGRRAWSMASTHRRDDATSLYLVSLKRESSRAEPEVDNLFRVY